MTLTYSTFNTFAEVEAHYNSIKPLRGRDNEGKDIRPIGDRRRKWERIVKVSPNCYALSDGHHFGDDLFASWTFGAQFTPTSADMEKYAPIVWRKRADGVEEVTLRNGWGRGNHNARYAFLYRHSPKGMWFRMGNRDGKHFIEASGTRYFLAKTTTTPRAIYDHIKQGTGQSYYHKRLRDTVRVQDDGASLTFTNVQGKWTLLSGGQEIPKPPRKLVNKDLKAKFKPHIDAFREWVFAIAPMVEVRGYEQETRMRADITAWFEANNLPAPTRWSIPDMIDYKLARAIMRDEEHPLRLHLGYIFLRYADDFKRIETEADVARIKRQYNYWVNEMLGFTKVVKG